MYLTHALLCCTYSSLPHILLHSATKATETLHDLIVTDPPYYDAIPYADLMDFFYVWLRRTLCGLLPEIEEVFKELVVNRWDCEKNDGELIDDESRFGGDTAK